MAFIFYQQKKYKVEPKFVPPFWTNSFHVVKLSLVLDFVKIYGKLTTLWTGISALVKLRINIKMIREIG